MDFEEIIDLGESWVLITDNQLNLKFINGAARSSLGINVASWKNKRLTDILHIPAQWLDYLGTQILEKQDCQIPVGIGQEEKTLLVKACGASNPNCFLFQLKGSLEVGVPIEKVREVGVLTGGLAHSMANPLSIVQLNCKSLEIECGQQLQLEVSNVRKKLEKIEKALNRVTFQTTRLKGISNLLTNVSEGEIDRIFEFDESDQFH